MYGNPRTKVINCKASTREIAEERALKRHPEAIGISHVD
jgi:hypothetical protein